MFFNRQLLHINVFENISLYKADIIELEQRVNALEIGKQYDITKDAVRKVEEEYLMKFRELKASLEQESMNGGDSSSTKELEELRNENQLLKQKNTKLEYRVQHMVSNMELMLDELMKLRKEQEQQ